MSKRERAAVHKGNERTWTLNPLCGGKGNVTTNNRSVTCAACKRKLASLPPEAGEQNAVPSGEFTNRKPEANGEGPSGTAPHAEAGKGAGVVEPNWLKRLSSQYGCRQIASLRADEEGVNIANLWIGITAKECCYEILKDYRALRAEVERLRGLMFEFSRAYLNGVAIV